MDKDLRYELALSILNGMAGISYQNLVIERQKMPPDPVAVSRLKAEYASVCARRDSLARGGEKDWQDAIERMGPVVKRRVEALQLDEQGRM